MRALRASEGYVGRTLRTRSPSFTCEMRTGATATGGATTGKTGRGPLPNKLGMPRGSPLTVLQGDGPNPATCGGPSALAAGMSLGIRVGILRVMSAELLRAAVFAPACILAAGGSPRG